VNDTSSTPVTQRRGSFAQTLRAVAWSFFGVRRSADYAEDVEKLNPVHVVIGGIAGAALFVAAIVLLVRWVVASGVAT
jgi:nitrate reductase gamma subunit